MKVGDLLEWLAAAAFVAAAAIGLALAWAFVVAGVALAYFGQCHAHAPFPKIARPKRLRRPTWTVRKSATQ